MPPILSYHVHLVYSLSDEFALQQAIDLMNAARMQFASMLGACVANKTPYTAPVVVVCSQWRCVTLLSVVVDLSCAVAVKL
jgi:hypothetical protein